MQDLNKVLVVGRLTKDIVVEYTNGGMAIAKGSIAVNRSQKKDGAWGETASFFDITLFGKMAENLKPYLLKGKQVAIGGYLKQDRWTSQDGQNRSKVYIGVEELQLCGGREGGAGNGTGSESFGNNDSGYDAAFNEADGFGGYGFN